MFRFTDVAAIGYCLLLGVASLLTLTVTRLRVCREDYRFEEKDCSFFLSDGKKRFEKTPQSAEETDKLFCKQRNYLPLF